MTSCARELSGEACQALYQKQLVAVLESLASKLPTAAYREALEHLLPWLYRADEDPRAQRARDAFESIVREYRRDLHVAGTYRPAIADLRGRIADAMRFAVERLRMVVEGGGAVALAAVLAGLWTPPEGDGAVVIVLSGGNVGAETLVEVLGAR